MTKKLMTWDDIVGMVHPEWNASEKTRRRIMNAAWGHGYSVHPITGLVKKGK
jgi:hypothetical protein